MARLIKPISQASAREVWKILREIADAANPEITKAFLRAVMDARNGFNRARLEKLLRMMDVEGAMNELNWDLIAKTELQPAVASTLRDVLDSAATFAPLPVVSEMAWDILNPLALAWIRDESSRLITNISQETKQAIRETIARGFQEGYGIEKMADPIRDILDKAKQNFGLNSRQAAAFDRYRNDLIKRGLPDNKIASLMETYHRRLIKERAELIARTETIKAANEGYRQKIEQAVSEDLIDPLVWEMRWIVTQDEKKCEKCQSMRGKRRPISGVYGEGEYAGTDGPPGHPNCRCAEGLTRISEQSVRRAA
jgi:uncharacterized protein with gpF-like domain